MSSKMVVAASVAGLCLLGYLGIRFGLGETHEPPRIATSAVTRGDVVDAVVGTAALEPTSTVEVGSQVSGMITELNADFNSIVKQGEVLARIDPSLVQAQIDQADANLTRARVDLERLRSSVADADRNLDRLQQLRSDKLVPESELDAARVASELAKAQLASAEAQASQAEAALEQRQVDLAHTIIRSPIDGVVISRRVEVGQTVAARMEAPVIYVIAPQLQHMRAIASVREADVGRVHPGLAVSLRADAYPARVFPGVVDEIRLQATSPRRIVTYPTVIDVPNDEFRLKPGMTASAAIEIARRTDVVRVPASALRFQPTEKTFDALGYEAPADIRPRLAPDKPDAADGAAGEEGEDDEDEEVRDPVFDHPAGEWQDDVWMMRDGKLTPIDVRLGISDGQYVELVDGPLQPGDELVWNLSAGSVRPAFSSFRGGGNRNNNRNNNRGRR
jgi:HlyD family secretion protein